MNQKMGYGLLLGGAFVGCLLVIHSAVTGLITAVDTNQLANVLVGYVASLIIGSVATISLIALGRKFTPINTIGSPPRREVISLASVPTPSYAPFPKTALVRNITDSSAPTHPRDTLEFRVSSGGMLEAKTIPMHYVRRFFNCSTPKRSEWKGNVNTYSDLLKIAKSYGWVCNRSDGENGVEWTYGWTDPQRRIERLQANFG